MDKQNDEQKSVATARQETQSGSKNILDFRFIAAMNRVILRLYILVLYRLHVCDANVSCRDIYICLIIIMLVGVLISTPGSFFITYS